MKDNAFSTAFSLSLSKVPDPDLFLYMSYKKGEDEIKAKAAFNEFYRRYWEYILRICNRSCFFYSDGENLAKDISQNTLYRIYLTADQFDISSAASSDEIVIAVKVFIGKIIKAEKSAFFKEFVNFNNSTIFSELEAFPEEIEEESPYEEAFSQVDEETFIKALHKLSSQVKINDVLN